MAPSPDVAAAQRVLLADVNADVDVHVVSPGVPTDALIARRSERDAARAAFGWSDRTVVGLVARLDRNKGQSSLIDAATRLVDADDSLHFVIAGGAVLGWEGPIAEQLAMLVDRRGLGDHVEFLGHLEDTVPVQVALDVAVNASVHESFGLSVLESMTLGTPVVATRTAGSTYLLDDGNAGWMCDTLDNVALAGAIGEAIRALREVDSPDQLERVQAAQDRSREFDAALTGRRVATLLREIVDARARPGHDHLTDR
jgi:glycosyltransferase involved in cell wall biosynthesis